MLLYPADTEQRGGSHIVEEAGSKPEDLTE